MVAEQVVRDRPVARWSALSHQSGPAPLNLSTLTNQADNRVSSAVEQHRLAEIVDHLLSNVFEYRMVEIRNKLTIDLIPINLGKEQMTTVAKVTDNDA